MSKIRLLIVDDSALIRQMLKQIFNSSDEIEVVGTAEDPFVAREKIKQLKPDVLTLDIEMPRMDGLTFLRNLMRLKPMPVVMISTLTEKGAAVTLEALEIGAVDFVAKPKVDESNSLQQYAEEIIAKVIMASKVPLFSLGSRTDNDQTAIEKPKSVSAAVQINSFNHSDISHGQQKIIALGSSTGGTEAIKQVVSSLPETTPAILIAQHLPVAFSDSFAKRVDAVSAMSASVAKHDEPILPGHIYIAPGDQHLKIARVGTKLICQLDGGPLVNRHKPSVEVLFRSAATLVGKNVIGVMLTGMGDDGAVAMKEMQQAGSVNIVQDQASSVVWGMPGEAVKQGAADHVVPLDDIASHILALAK